MVHEQRARIETDIRAITEADLAAWVRALDASFLLAVPEGAMELRRQLFTPGRSFGAFAAEECVGTLRSLDLELTVPGGRAVLAEGITNVGVVPGHRRRGLLSRMMRISLDDARARGNCLAALIASEYRIHGRFGFGPATRTVAYDIDVRRAGAVRVPGGRDGSVKTATLEAVRKYGPEVHDQFRATQAGAINREQVVWRLRTGELRNPYRDGTEPWAVLYRDAHGVPAGMALFRVDDTSIHGDPDYTLTVDDLIAVDATAGAMLWRHLLGTEGVNRVTVNSVAPDDPLPLLLDNPRACMPRTATGRDHLWLRILDVPAALQARN
jgi:predicted acetyltransferase